MGVFYVIYFVILLLLLIDRYLQDYVRFQCFSVCVCVFRTVNTEEQVQKNKTQASLLTQLLLDD